MRLQSKKIKGRRTKLAPKKSVSTVGKYYSPSMRGQREGLNSSRGDGLSPGRNPRKFQIKSIARVIIKWSGAMGIAAVLLVNVLLGGVSVKARTNELNVRSQDEYDNAVEELFNQSIFNRLKFTFGSDNFEQELRQKLPEIDSAVAVVPLVGTKLQVVVSVSRPVARQALGGGKQGLINSQGVLIHVDDSTAVLSAFADLPLISVSPTVDFKLAQQVFTSKEMVVVSRLNAEFDGTAKERHRVESISYSIEKREFTVRFRGAPYYAKLTSETAPDLQIGALLSALKDLESSGGVAGEYIDVRVVGRVFVK